MNRGCNHAAHNRSSDWFHHIGANAGLPQDGDETRENDADGHQFRPQTMHRAFDDGGFDVFMLERLTRCEAAVECFVQVHDHNYARLDRDTEESDVADPHRHAEVVAEEFLQDEPPG